MNGAVSDVDLPPEVAAGILLLSLSIENIGLEHDHKTVQLTVRNK